MFANFINVCHTLAGSLELLQCHYRLGESYSEDTLDVGPGKFGTSLYIQQCICTDGVQCFATIIAHFC